jgi:CheY-like chemotaxis protein/chemotaxis protein CheY-P-specific phosphatase CheC
MSEYAKLRKMIQSALKQSAEESSLLLNKELTVNDTEVLDVGKTKYLEDLDDSAFVVPIESRDDYPGRFFMVFSLRDAILMSGILLGIPPARISEKRKLLILEADDIDAFSEIANQIIGSFNSVFQPYLPNKFHLKQLPPTKFVPQMDEISDELPVPDGEFLVYKAQIKLGGEELNRFDILVPFPLADLFDPPEITADAESIGADIPHDQAESLRKLFPSDSEEEEHASVHSAGVRTVLVLEDDPKVREKLKVLLTGRGFTAITAHLGEDLYQFFQEEGIHAVVLGTAKAEDWELSLCARLRDLSRNPQLPIIMSALQWTRTDVLRAVQNGARDIMIKPYEESELLGKLAKFLDAA